MHDAYEPIQDRTIAELQTRARLFRHRRTGAQVLSMENADENKVFGIAFRTPPRDSTGLPHILEHSVLCGSRKYPVREPFVELLKGSLHTFLNAFTYPDKTCYPVASQNVKDFYNLIDVYLDAVFHPRLTPRTLEQEGWHYEVEDPAKPLAFKGVVFNEMKGAYSSPDSLLYRVAQQNLFPDTPYGVDSGGDPREIPNLTFEQMQAFHRAYYHPSNARVFFWGDDDPAERLRYLDGWLSAFDRADVRSDVPLQPPFPSPRRVSHPFAVAPDSPDRDKGMALVNWLWPETTDIARAFACDLLAYILSGTSAAPLHKALIDSGLGEDIVGGHVEADLRQMVYSIGLRGLLPSDAPKMEDLLRAELEALARDGVPAAMVEAALNTLEFRLRENNTGSYPRGLFVMLRALTTWLYDADPVDAVAFEAPLQTVKDRIRSAPRFFEDLIRSLLLDNPHRLTVTMEPDPGYAAAIEREERAVLDAARARCSAEDLRRLADETRALREAQVAPDRPEDLARIPSLRLEDLDRASRPIPIEEDRRGPARLVHHDLFTGGILYVDVGFHLRSLPAELLPLAAILGRLLLETGTDGEDFVSFSLRIDRQTGGVSASELVATELDTRDAAPWFLLRGKCLPAQAGDLLAIFADALLRARIDDRERVRQIVLEDKSSLEAGIVHAGHQVVRGRLDSLFSEAGWMSEQLHGVEHLFALRRLSERIESDWPAVREELRTLRARLVRRGAALANVTCPRADWDALRPRLEAFLGALPEPPRAVSWWPPARPHAAEALSAPSQVQFVGKAVNLYESGYAFHASSLVATRFLRTTWLWERVRVQGGAYGAFAHFDRATGVFGCTSYRDPNVESTFDAFDGAGRFLREAELPVDEIRKAVIGAIGEIDHPLLPDAKGHVSLVRRLIGLTEEERQRTRDQVLGTTREDLRAFGEAIEALRERGIPAVLGSAEALAKSCAEWSQVRVL